MFVRVYRTLGDPQPVEQEAVLVVIEGQSGQPVCVATELGQGIIAAATADDPEFNRMLRNLGLHKTVIVSPAHIPAADELPQVF